MKRMKWLFGVLMGAALLFQPLASGTCAPVVRYQMMNIAPVGPFSLPSDLIVTPWPKEWSSLSNNPKLDQEELEALKKALGVDRLKEFEAYETNIYQLAMDDGDVYHVAWLLAMRDKKVLDKPANDSMHRVLTPEERDKVEEAQNAIKLELLALNERLKSFQMPAAVPGGKPSLLWIQVLGLTPFEYPVLADTQAFGAGLRLLVRTDTLYMPLFLKGYAIAPDSHLSLLAIATADSDREFWSPIWERAVRTMYAPTVNATTPKTANPTANTTGNANANPASAGANATANAAGNASVNADAAGANAAANPAPKAP